MTTLFKERINGLPDSADSSSTPEQDYAEATYDAAEQRGCSLTPQEKFAKDAVTRLFDYLEETHNNPTYHQSNAYTIPRDWLVEHAPSIEKDVAIRLGSLSMDNILADVAALYRLKHNPPGYESNDYGGYSPLPKAFEASRFMYAGIEDIVNPVIERFAQGDDSVELINDQTIQALGATMVRCYYLEEFSGRQPDFLTPDDFQRIENVYKQNTLSHIRVAARIEHQAENNQGLASVHQLPGPTENNLTNVA